MVALPVLVSGLEAEMIRLGYKDSTLAWYHGAWRRLQRYFTFRGVEEFSLDVAMEWVDEACGGFFAKEQAGTLRQTDVYLFRVAQMLGDCHGPYSAGMSRHGAPARARHLIPSMSSRNGHLRGRPGPFAGGSTAARTSSSTSQAASDMP